MTKVCNFSISFNIQFEKNVAENKTKAGMTVAYIYTIILNTKNRVNDN